MKLNAKYSSSEKQQFAQSFANVILLTIALFRFFATLFYTISLLPLLEKGNNLEWIARIEKYTVKP